MNYRERIYIALDRMDRTRALCAHFKIHSLFDRYGPVIIDQLRCAGAHTLWVDAKLYDIPETVAWRSEALAKAGADIISVHSRGKRDMIARAVEYSKRVYAVTNLTSEEETLDTSSEIRSRAYNAMIAGVAGVTCPPHILDCIKGWRRLEGLDIVSPAMRLSQTDRDGHDSVMTPIDAFRNGATHIVLGRELFHTDQKPRKVLSELLEDLERIQL